MSGKSLQFVTTSIQRSSDGFKYEEEEVKKDETTRVPRDLQKLQHRTLYDQLQDNKRQQETEEEEFRRMLKAPPRALNTEEVDFLSKVEDDRRKREEEEMNELQSSQAEFEAEMAARRFKRKQLTDTLLKRSYGGEGKGDADSGDSAKNSAGSSAPAVAAVRPRPDRQATLLKSRVRLRPREAAASQSSSADEPAAKARRVEAGGPPKQSPGNAAGSAAPEDPFAAYGSSDDDDEDADCGEK